MIESLPDGDALIVIWFKILTLAGQVNEGGQLYISADIPYTEQLLANQFGRPITTVQLALRTFEQLGMIEVVDDIIRVSNWERYQNVDGMEKIREQTRNRVAKYRERKKELLIGSNRICAYCGGEGNTIDHVIPKVKGGLDIPENTVPCCENCNKSKNNKDVDVFLNDRLLRGERVCLEDILSNSVLNKYITFDYLQNRFVTLHSNADVTQCNADRNKNKRIEIESREEEPRNSEREIQEETDTNVSVKKKFVPPTVEEVSEYCFEQNLGIDPEAFVDYYNANGWMIGGKAHMKDWRAAARNWDRKRKADKSNPNSRYLTKGEQAKKDMDDFYQMTREWIEESTNDASGIR